MEINRNNYEEFFLLYVDNELPAGDRKAVEEFVKLHPDLKEELDILSETVLTPGDDIVFEGKEELYKEEERKIVPFRWWRMAAAAVLLFGLGTFGWLYLNNEPRHISPVAGVKKNVEAEKNIIKDEPEIIEPVITKEERSVTEPVIKKTETPKVKTEPKKTDRDLAPQTDVPNIDIAIVEEPAAPIDMAVTPRKLDKEINDAAANTLNTASREPASEEQPQSKPEYIETSDDNIYFANTSVSKRNKFRGVFRKATRILDKVTSL